MPIIETSFKDGIFFAREVGHIDREDAKVWAAQIARCAAESSTPIVSLIDALEVTFITTEARKIFVQASRIPNLKCAAVAAAGGITAQTARVIGHMAERDHTYVFASLEEARRFAEAQLDTASTSG